MLNILELTDPEASSVKYLRFSNGSKITAIPTSGDAGRGEALTLLVVDECVAGNTTITIRNKNTGEIRAIPISDLLRDEYK